ncbi:unnamed protein product [Hydatigera taeniaeformis]|uniref:Helicase ATP-binding domain-containing protein n=1 Tax=Hydatigena taeniaeformis TaxID=6205 RepID=A0A0R3XBY2_HYDTA|nr:unnamed protein product [Hydatigera taeniaeformis]
MKHASRISKKAGLLEGRPYQVEIANIARSESIIVKLGTGLGKSFIAAMVIKDHLPETYRPVAEGGKRILLVAKTVHLVYQLAEFLRSQLPVAPEEIGIYHGQVAPSIWIDSWTKGIWQEQLERHRVLVTTAGVLRDVLNHRKLSLNDVCLIIFDECHHADPDSKSDYTDICQHLHSFPPGRWLPDYSRGPKGCCDTRLEPNDPYYEVSQVLLRGVEKLRQLSCGAGREDYIDLEALLDENKRIKKEAFLTVMELHEFSPSKVKRLFIQCLRTMEEFGVYCAAHACEQFERVLKGLLLLSSSKVVTSPQCVSIIQTCLTSLAEALETYRQIRQSLTASLTQPPASNATDPAWGEWIMAHFPLSSKMVSLLRLLLHYRRVVEGNNENLAALLLVKERIAAVSVAHLITEMSAVTPLYGGLKASYCISANKTNPVVS